MATSERIKTAMAALEEECAKANLLASCFKECRHELDDTTNEPNWISQFDWTVSTLTAVADKLICAINGVDQ